MVVPFLVLVQAQAASVAGTYRLYASAMIGATSVPATAGTLVLRRDSTYGVDGGKGRFVLGKGSARFLSGPYAGGTATFSRRAVHLRVNVVTGFPNQPGRKLKLFGNRS